MTIDHKIVGFFPISKQTPYLMVSVETGRSINVRAGSGIFYPLEYDVTLYKVIKPSYKEKTQLSKRIKNSQFGAPEP